MRCKILCEVILHRRLIALEYNLFKFKVNHTNLSRGMSTKNTFLEQSKIDLKEIFYAAVKAVSPKSIIRTKVKVDNETMYIDNKSFPLRENVYLVGFGKAVMEMAIILEEMLGSKLKKGIVSVPKATKDAIWASDDKSSFPRIGTMTIEYREGATDNQPDNDSLETTHNILDLVESLTESDTLIVLVSGGGSALLYMPRPVIDLDDKMQLCKMLQNAGADITELNTVRKKLSMVKGGGLARIAYPANVISLILSDIVDDPIGLIASGPTVYSSKAPDEVVAILKKYNLFKSVEGDLKKAIMSQESFDDGPLLTPTKEFKHVNNIIVANNMLAIEAARTEVLRKKLTPIFLRNDIKGNVHDVSLAYADITNLICLALSKSLSKEEFLEKMQKLPTLTLDSNKIDEIYNHLKNIDNGGVVLIGGGEPTVVVKGKGKGGRNQELALYFSLDWLAKIKGNPQLAKYDVMMLSAGTDGQDGPTDAAGAFGYPGIGPIIHNVYAKLKSMTAKEILKLEEIQKESIKFKTMDDKKPVDDPCKRNVLSGYITLQKKVVPQSKPNETEQKLSDNRTHQNINLLTLTTMEVDRMLPENVLKENDSYNFFSRFNKGADLLKTGFTGTNVMDLHFIYIKKRQCGCDIDQTAEYVPKDVLEEHDLHIDQSTIDKYNSERVPILFKKDSFLTKAATDKFAKTQEHLNITITDENLADPCCNKERKMPKSQRTN